MTTIDTVRQRRRQPEPYLPATWQWASFACAAALLVLGVLWELWLAPLRPGGSWLVLKVLPLIPVLNGFARARIYTFRWSSLLVWLYVLEGLARWSSDQGLSRILGGIEVALAVALFFCVAKAVRTVVHRYRADAANPAKPNTEGTS